MGRDWRYFFKVINAFLLLSMVNMQVCAKDFGIVGHTYDIKEQDMVEYIKDKLKTVDLTQLEEDTKTVVRKAVNRPVPVVGITRSEENRTYYYDPTFVLEDDLYDHLGKLIHKAGIRINPLERMPFVNDLVFIDGDDEEQVEFALKSYKDRGKKTKIVLINGSPIDLQKKHKIRIYFDQSGILTSKFNIKNAPAVVSQDKLKLKIEEVKL